MGTKTAGAIQAWLIEQLSERLEVQPSEIDPCEPFTDYGLDSLEAVNLAGDLELWLGRRLSPELVWTYPTIEELSRHLAEAPSVAEQSTEAPPIEVISRRGDPGLSGKNRDEAITEDVFVFPLSFSQQRLWLVDQLAPGNPSYNVPGAVRLTGRLDVAALERSANEVIRRHEALRTTFAIIDGQPVQVIAPTLTLPLTVVDLRKLPENEGEAQVRKLATEQAQQPFDLAQGPLLRITLLRLGEEQHVLLLTVHHIISDGWSRSVLSREMAALYESFSAGKPSPLPELTIQYADFAVWQRQWLQGEVLETLLAYWKQQLGGSLPVLQLPTDRPRPAAQTSRGAKQSLMFPRTLSERLKALSRREGVTLFMTLLAAFQTLLHRYTDQDDIIVGSPIANRNRPEIDGLIGFFVNMLVLRVDFSGNPSFRELLERVREVALGAYAHQDLPFEKLVEELQPERGLSRNPLFQVAFVLQNVPMETMELPGLTFSLLDVDSGTARFDLTLSLQERPEGLIGSLEYNTDLLDAATIARMSGHFQVLLEDVVENPDKRLSELSMISEETTQQLIGDFNADLELHKAD